jgi:hypothetical protein
MSWKNSFLSKSPIKVTEGETETAKARRVANMDFHKAEQESFKRFNETPEGKAAYDLYMNNQIDEGAEMDPKTGMVKVRNRMTGETSLVNVGETKKIKRDYFNAASRFRSQDAEYQEADKKIRSGLKGGGQTPQQAAQNVLVPNR